MNKTLLEQLAQLVTATWDGNLISKSARDQLVKNELAQRAHGYNWITAKGVEILTLLNVLRH